MKNVAIIITLLIVSLTFSLVVAADETKKKLPKDQEDALNKVKSAKNNNDLINIIKNNGDLKGLVDQALKTNPEEMSNQRVRDFIVHLAKDRDSTLLDRHKESFVKHHFGAKKLGTSDLIYDTQKKGFRFTKLVTKSGGEVSLDDSVSTMIPDNSAGRALLKNAEIVDGKVKVNTDKYQATVQGEVEIDRGRLNLRTKTYTGGRMKVDGVVSDIKRGSFQFKGNTKFQLSSGTLTKTPREEALTSSVNVDVAADGTTKISGFADLASNDDSSSDSSTIKINGGATLKDGRIVPLSTNYNGDKRKTLEVFVNGKLSGTVSGETAYALEPGRCIGSKACVGREDGGFKVFATNLDGKEKPVVDFDIHSSNTKVTLMKASKDATINLRLEGGDASLSQLRLVQAVTAGEDERNIVQSLEPGFSVAISYTADSKEKQTRILLDRDGLPAVEGEFPDDLTVGIYAADPKEFTEAFATVRKEEVKGIVQLVYTKGDQEFIIEDGEHIPVPTSDSGEIADGRGEDGPDSDFERPTRIVMGDDSRVTVVRKRDSKVDTKVEDSSGDGEANVKKNPSLEDLLSGRSKADKSPEDVLRTVSKGPERPKKDVSERRIPFPTDTDTFGDESGLPVGIVKKVEKERPASDAKARQSKADEKADELSKDGAPLPTPSPFRKAAEEAKSKADAAAAIENAPLPDRTPGRGKDANTKRTVPLPIRNPLPVDKRGGSEVDRVADTRNLDSDGSTTAETNYKTVTLGDRNGPAVAARRLGEKIGIKRLSWKHDDFKVELDPTKNKAIVDHLIKKGIIEESPDEPIWVKPKDISGSVRARHFKSDMRFRLDNQKKSETKVADRAEYKAPTASSGSDKAQMRTLIISKKTGNIFATNGKGSYTQIAGYVGSRKSMKLGSAGRALSEKSGHVRFLENPNYQSNLKTVQIPLDVYKDPKKLRNYFCKTTNVKQRYFRYC